MSPLPSPEAKRHSDPVEAIRAHQRSEQRFRRGIPWSALAAVMLVPVWMFTFASWEPGSKIRLVAAAIAGALVGLPLRLIGRVSEVRLALVAGALATVAVWLGDYLAQVLWSNSAPSLVPRGEWWQSIVTYAVTLWTATVAGRKELDVSLSDPNAGGGPRIELPPQVWHDLNAIVLEEPGNHFRGWLSVPGKLVLTPKELRFVQRGKDAPDPVIPLRELLSTGQGLNANTFTVSLRDGKTHRFVAFDRDKWIVHINALLRAAADANSTPAG